MRINEILIESEEHMRLYWTLKGIDINAYYAAYEGFIKDPNKFISKQNMLQLSSFVHELLSDSSWQYLENDPDFDATYNKLLNLYDSVQKYLQSA